MYRSAARIQTGGAFRPGPDFAIVLPMRRFVPFFAVFATLAMPFASAENPFTNATGGGEEGGVAASQPREQATPPRPEAKPDILLRMSKKDCERLIRRADVPGAEYKAGVDVRGNRVAGADLAGTLTAADVLPKEIAFELSMNPLGYAGNEDLADIFSESSTSFGQVRFDLSSGALSLNGKRLNGATEAEMLALCRQALNR